MEIPFENLSCDFSLKWKDIPFRNDYHTVMDESFWANFPKTDSPTVPETKIDVEKLESKVESHREKLLQSQFERARKAVNFLRFGAPAFQKSFLSGCYVKITNTTLWLQITLQL